ALAQQPDPNGNPFETEERMTGCTRLAVFPPLPSAKVTSCQKSDSVEVSMPLKPDESGYAQEKKVRGAYEFREYQIKKDQDSTFDSLIDALPMSSFTIAHSVRPATITARNGGTWILINISENSYNVSVVRGTAVQYAAVYNVQAICSPTKDADQISQEMRLHSRFAIYGLQFSPENRISAKNSSEILATLLEYLRQNPDSPVFIESHKFTA